jgi:hypothetical protein
MMLEKRGAAIGSDHHLVVALFQLKVLASQEISSLDVCMKI